VRFNSVFKGLKLVLFVFDLIRLGSLCVSYTAYDSSYRVQLTLKLGCANNGKCWCQNLFKYIYPLWWKLHRRKVWAILRSLYFLCQIVLWSELALKVNVSNFDPGGTWFEYLYQWGYEPSCCTYMGRVSSVRIATRYGLDGPGIESQWGRGFRTCPDRPWDPPSLIYNG
jgi:hypothetical protein